MKRIKLLFTSVLTFIFAAALLFKQAEAISGVSDGMLICTNIIIPSLFPFLVVSKFITMSGVSDFIGKFADKGAKKLFFLPGSAAAGIVMSFIGGYPVGAAAAAELYKKGEISEKQVELMTLFCVCPGPAFAVGAIGLKMTGSSRPGLILYISTMISALIIGLAVARFYKTEKPYKLNQAAGQEKKPLAETFVEATASSCTAMLHICTFIIFFSCVLKLIDAFGLPKQWSVFLSVLFEVTNGSAAAFNRFGITGAAFAAGFAGLSIHFQILGILNVKISLTKFFAARLVNGLLCAFISSVLLKFFPYTVPVFSNGARPAAELSRTTGAASAALMLMSVILLVSLSSQKRKKLDFNCDI